MVLDIISICLSVCLLVVILLLYRHVLKRFNDIGRAQGQVLKRFNDIGRAQGQVLKRFNFFMENVQVQPSNQNDQLKSDDQVEEVDPTNESWQRQFADRFISYLKTNNSPLVPIFMGERTWSYPNYIGFDIRRLEGNVDLNDNNAFWLVAHIGYENIIHLKLHMRNRNYFNRLKSQEAAIHGDFGNSLKWEDQNRELLRIGVDLQVNPLSQNSQEWTEHFEKMRKNLEKLDVVFRHRVNEIFEDNTSSSSFDDEDDILF